MNMLTSVIDLVKKSRIAIQFSIIATINIFGIYLNRPIKNSTELIKTSKNSRIAKILQPIKKAVAILTSNSIMRLLSITSIAVMCALSGGILPAILLATTIIAAAVGTWLDFKRYRNLELIRQELSLIKTVEKELPQASELTSKDLAVKDRGYWRALWKNTKSTIVETINTFAINILSLNVVYFAIFCAALLCSYINAGCVRRIEHQQKTLLKDNLSSLKEKYELKATTTEELYTELEKKLGDQSDLNSIKAAHDKHYSTWAIFKRSINPITNITNVEAGEITNSTPSVEVSLPAVPTIITIGEHETDCHKKQAMQTPKQSAAGRSRSNPSL